MRIGKRAIVTLLAATLTLGAAASYGTPAVADEDPALAALTQVVPDIIKEAKAEPPTEIPDGNVQRVFSAVTDHTLRVDVSDIEVGIGLPEATGAGNRPLPGLVTYSATRSDVAFAHQRTGQIGRVLTVIKGASAPTEYRFPITAPEGSTLEVEEDDQTVIIYNNDIYLAEID